MRRSSAEPPAASGSPGGNLDGSNAGATAALANAADSPDAAYQSLVTGLGAAAQTVNQQVGVQSTLTTNADAAVSSESGVNIDEEMTNLLSYQRAYQAASKVMTTVDSTLDTLINHTGLLGG